MGDKWPREWQTDYEYYILSDDTLARVLYDPATESYIDGQIMDNMGYWDECPPLDILEDGVEVTPRQAADIAREFGGELV